MRDTVAHFSCFRKRVIYDVGVVFWLILKSYMKESLQFYSTHITGLKPLSINFICDPCQDLQEGKHRSLASQASQDLCPMVTQNQTISYFFSNSKRGITLDHSNQKTEIMIKNCTILLFMGWTRGLSEEIENISRVHSTLLLEKMPPNWLCSS